MRLIGLHGPLHSGRATITAWLCARHGFSRFAMASPRRDGLAAMFRLSRFDLEDRAARQAPIHWLGTSPAEIEHALDEAMRAAAGADVWLRLAAERLRHYHKFSGDIVVTDVERPDEADWIRRAGGAIWHILRPLAQNVRSLHPGEHAVPIVLGTDSTIDNSAGLEQLRAEIAHALAGGNVVQAPAA